MGKTKLIRCQFFMYTLKLPTCVNDSFGEKLIRTERLCLSILLLHCVSRVHSTNVIFFPFAAYFQGNHVPPGKKISCFWTTILPLFVSFYVLNTSGPFDTFTHAYNSPLVSWAHQACSTNACTILVLCNPVLAQFCLCKCFIDKHSVKFSKAILRPLNQQLIIYHMSLHNTFPLYVLTYINVAFISVLAP